jgi:hypothetical protein
VCGGGEGRALRGCASEPEADLRRKGDGFVALSPGGRSNFTGTSSSTKNVLKNDLLGWLWSGKLLFRSG